MRHLPSKFKEYPTALEMPELSSSERTLQRSQEIAEWLEGLDLRYNRDYVCFEHLDGKPGYRQNTVMAWAFKRRDLALQFKLVFGGWQ